MTEPELIHTGRACEKCGEEITATTPQGAKLRRECMTCRPPQREKRRLLKKQGLTVPVDVAVRVGPNSDPVEGVAFTVAHFKRWAERLITDTGKRFRLERYQADYLKDLFHGGGDAGRTFREAWLLVPEGNGKSTFVALVSLYHIEHTPFAFVPVAASSRDQAMAIFKQAEGFKIRNDMHQFKVNPGYRKIVCPKTHGEIQVFAADASTGDGVIPTLAWLDELHRHKGLDLYRTWSGKLSKRSGQLGVISTAGEPGTEFELTREAIRQTAKVRQVKGCHGRYADAGKGIVLHEWAVPEKGDVNDMRLVKQANPFSGITIASLKRKRETPTMTLQHWSRLTCNLPTRSSIAAISEREWAGARVAESVIPAKAPIWVGLDVAWKWDTTALATLYMPDLATRVLGPARILDPPRDGGSLDPYLVEDALIWAAEHWTVHTLVMDTSRAEQLAEWAANEIGCRVVDRGQSNLYAVNDFNRFMEGLRGGQLKHVGDPGLTRHVLNAVTRDLPGGDSRFDRPARGRRAAQVDGRVIDGLTAASMVHATAVADMLQADKPTRTWVAV